MGKCPFLEDCTRKEDVEIYGKYRQVCLGEDNHIDIPLDGDHCPIYLFKATTEEREKRWKVF